MASDPETTPKAVDNVSTPSHYHPPDGRNLLGHISIGVRSATVSEKFYTAILAPFGVSLIYNSISGTTGTRTLGYGFASHPNKEMLNIFERGETARAPGAGSHIAFNAPSRQAVRSFWEAGVNGGGRDAGESGVRGHYGQNYYAAFLWDPDGWKVEAVFQG